MTPKQAALNAIDTARKMLATPDPITGLQRSLLCSTLDFAAERIEQIAELKRARKEKPLSAQRPPREEAP